jgi:hypothetical protein
MPLLTNEQDSEELSHDINLDTHQSDKPSDNHLVIPGYTAEEK